MQWLPKLIILYFTVLSSGSHWLKIALDTVRSENVIFGPPSKLGLTCHQWQETWKVSAQWVGKISKFVPVATTPRLTHCSNVNLTPKPVVFRFCSPKTKFSRTLHWSLIYMMTGTNINTVILLVLVLVLVLVVLQGLLLVQVPLVPRPPSTPLSVPIIRPIRPV